ncbi:MAG: hypothetical protein ACXQS6_06055 [Candidatus Syntropharchaeales archaeon]
MIAVQGKKYDFEVVAEYEPPVFCFFIEAKCRTTGRFSCINNLNAVLSAFKIETDDPKTADSMWVVGKDEIDDFVDTAREFLSDSCFLDYLERCLDEDRMEGEWENVH